MQLTLVIGILCRLKRVGGCSNLPVSYAEKAPDKYGIEEVSGS